MPLAELNDVLGTDLLSKILNRKQAALKKYLSSPHKIPTQAEDRINFLTAIVRNRDVIYSHLAIRQWLQKEHPKLGGKRPLDLLSGNWWPRDPEIMHILILSHWSEP